MFFCVQARGLGIRLATPIPADADAARRIKYRSRHKGFKTGEKAKMAAITGESIFGSGKESSAQARKKAVLVKAAKLGIKTKGMRLLKADEGDAMRAPRRAASGTGASAPHPSPKSEPRRKETRKRQRHAESSGSRAEGVHEDRWRGNGAQVDVGPVDDESASVTSVPVRLREEEHGEETTVVVSKKRRKMSSRRPQAAPAATASSSSSTDGLAAIAGIY